MHAALHVKIHLGLITSYSIHAIPHPIHGRPSTKTLFHTTMNNTLDGRPGTKTLFHTTIIQETISQPVTGMVQQRPATNAAAACLLRLQVSHYQYLVSDIHAVPYQLRLFMQPLISCRPGSASPTWTCSLELHTSHDVR
jgi:hypothetical protein